MNPRSAFRREIIYLVGIAGLLAMLAWLGRPATSVADRAEGSSGGKLAQLREEYELSQAQLGQIDPTSETIKLATLGLRGVAANILWEKANRYKMKKDWTNLSATLEQITKVQPNFISVWRFQAWNLSYNVSVEFEDFRERYRWVIRGINFLRKGVEYNKREPRLLWDVGWFIANKIGRADEYKQFRRLFKQDDDFHDALPFEVRHPTRDNWLVGKQWFIKAADLTDALSSSVRGMSPLIFRSDPPMCQMSYAEALEEDGIFGERAELAWRKAGKEWEEYGSIEIPLPRGFSIRLNDQERFEENARKLIDQIDAAEPELREKIAQEKRAALTEQQRAALDTPPEERTTEQQTLAAEADRLVKVTPQEVARRITGPKRPQALKWAKQASQAREMAELISRYRHIVNFEYWRLRAEMEQNKLTLAARKLIYQGDQAFADGDLIASRQNYENGFAAWRRVLDKFPEMIPNPIFGGEMMEVIQRYRQVLDQLDEELPKDFILQDVVEEHKDRR